MNPFGTFLAIHFEVGGDTRSLGHQKAFWPSTVGLVDLANRYDAKLTLQFNPQWAEYILKDRKHLSIIKEWQKRGHEIGLHHHGYVHGDWDGYSNRKGKELTPGFRGNILDMMELMGRMVQPGQIFSGTISDEMYDYPQGLRYDTEGIRIQHARSIPKRVTLGGRKVIQVGMAFLSFEGDIESFKREYQKSMDNEVFGVVTHEKDFAKNLLIIEEWLKFIASKQQTITTVSQTIIKYQRVYTLGRNKNPLTFFKDVYIKNKN